MLANLHHAIARALAQADHPDAPVLAQIAEEEAANARALSTNGGASAPHDPLPAEPKTLIDLALERLEATLELYLTLAEVSRDEEVVAAAQRLSESAVRRLDRLR